MVHVVKNTVADQRKYSSDIEQCLDNCKEKFNQILFGVLNECKGIFFNFWKDESDPLSLPYRRCKFCAFRYCIEFASTLLLIFSVRIR